MSAVGVTGMAPQQAPVPEQDVGTSMIIPDELVEIDYTNYEGKRAIRIVWPRRLVFKSTLWHPKPQWIIEGRDAQRGVDRDFAWKDVHSMKPFEGILDVC